MTLEGANVFFDASDYAIYTMNSTNTGQYCVVLPKNNNGTYNMLVDLHMKSSFDSINSGSKTKEQLIEEIKNEYVGVKTKYNDGILVIPMIDENLYASAVINNDKQKMFDKVKKIGAITSEIYKKLTDGGIDKQKIDQKIIIIIKNNDDIKFVDWLKEQMPNFVIGVNASELQPVNNANPFMAESPAPAVPNDIFGAPTNNQETLTVSSVNNNVFNTPPVSQTAPANDIFSTPTSAAEPVTPVPTPEVQQQVQQLVAESNSPVQPMPAPQEVPTLTAVQATPLEATTTITPVTDQNSTTGEQSSGENIPAQKGSKGFTNLLILLVVLVGVTLFSIELGKFLYNTFGA